MLYFAHLQTKLSCRLILMPVVFSIGISSARADRLSADVIPPDVTLTSSQAAAISTSPSAQAPGLSSAGVVSSAGNNAQAASPASNLPTSPILPSRGRAQYTLPGQAPSPPPLPTGGERQMQAGGAQTPPAGQDPIAVIETNKGTIMVRLFQSLAPRTVANFVDLCSKGFYNGLTWHRVERGFCIQGGDPKGDGSGVYIDSQSHVPRYLQLEVSPQLTHNAKGVVAMARSDNPNSASCQFYITLAPAPSLDGKYAVFGGVISGMDVLDRIVKGDKMNTVSVRLNQ